MRELLLKFDHVVIDTPAAEFGADATVIRGQGRRRPRHRAARRVADGRIGGPGGHLSDTPAKLAGVIMNEY